MDPADADAAFAEHRAIWRSSAVTSSSSSSRAGRWYLSWVSLTTKMPPVSSRSWRCAMPSERSHSVRARSMYLR
jgi:hypothetical protein